MNKIHPLFSFSLPLSLYFSLSYFLGGDCSEWWRNKDTGPGYALSDEQRRNAFIHRRRWWWMRGAHQREPIRSCSRTTNEERRGIEGTGGWESGINVARASSTNHSPSDLETLGALLPLFNYLAVYEKRTLLPAVRTPPPLRAPSLVTRFAPREEKEEAVPNDGTDAGPVLSWLRSTGQQSERFPYQQDDDREYHPLFFSRFVFLYLFLPLFFAFLSLLTKWNTSGDGMQFTQFVDLRQNLIPPSEIFSAFLCIADAIFIFISIFCLFVKSIIKQGRIYKIKN